MLQKISDSRSNSKDLKDFIIKIEEIESLKNELKRKTATIQNKTEENDQLKASRNLLQDENKRLTQINNNLIMENEKFNDNKNNYLYLTRTNWQSRQTMRQALPDSWSWRSVTSISKSNNSKRNTRPKRDHSAPNALTWTRS